MIFRRTLGCLTANYRGLNVHLVSHINSSQTTAILLKYSITVIVVLQTSQSINTDSLLIALQQETRGASI